jgi:hypothetical protein
MARDVVTWLLVVAILGALGFAAVTGQWAYIIAAGVLAVAGVLAARAARARR